MWFWLGLAAMALIGLALVLIGIMFVGPSLVEDLMAFLFIASGICILALSWSLVGAHQTISAPTPHVKFTQTLCESNIPNGVCK